MTTTHVAREPQAPGTIDPSVSPGAAERAARRSKRGAERGERSNPPVKQHLVQGGTEPAAKRRTAKHRRSAEDVIVAKILKLSFLALEDLTRAIAEEPRLADHFHKSLTAAMAEQNLDVG